MNASSYLISNLSYEMWGIHHWDTNLWTQNLNDLSGQQFWSKTKDYHWQDSWHFTKTWFEPCWIFKLHHFVKNKPCITHHAHHKYIWAMLYRNIIFKLFQKYINRNIFHHLSHEIFKSFYFPSIRLFHFTNSVCRWWTELFLQKPEKLSHLLIFFSI